MERRTFGWSQDASNLDSLTEIIKALTVGTTQHFRIIELIKRYVVDQHLKDRMIESLNVGSKYPYVLLKGSKSTQLTVEQNQELFSLDLEAATNKTKKGGRANESCTGIVQICLPAQTKAYYKPYQSDWSAESYLKLAISLNLISYDPENDQCTLTDTAKRIALGDQNQQLTSYREAILSFPPAVRILQILSQNMTTPLSKFELGANLGFIGEAGFGSFAPNMFLWFLNSSQNAKERAENKNNKERMCDKYARMTCSFLEKLDLITTTTKELKGKWGNLELEPTRVKAYQITKLGYDLLINSYGNSSHPKIPRRVLYETLATAAPDRSFLRYRRAHILNLLKSKSLTTSELQAKLKLLDLDVPNAVILEDLEGLNRIGIRIDYDRHTQKYKLVDQIIGLVIPHEKVQKEMLTLIKERVIDSVKHVDPKYFELLDLAFTDTKTNATDLEILTAELFIEELQYKGQHLGGANKPDIAVYYEQDGLIIDTKAYAKGFSISAHQRDEMSRYINDNQKRDLNINPNAWWKVFAPEVKNFNHLFVSSTFIGKFAQQLQYIAKDKNQNGACISVENLLVMAERIKTKMLKQADIKDLMKNDEIKFD